TVTLDAGPSSDPDGDSLSFKWWVYKEAGTYPGNLSITNNGSRLATLKVPVVNSSYRISIVLEVKDSGSPSSTRYQRVILEVRP
ncbi:MAG TPA: hypothetical protein VHL31_26515, partial [Geminicoccus sp.]